MEIIYPYACLQGLHNRLLKAEQDSCGMDTKAMELRKKVEHAAMKIPQGASLSFDYDELKEYL